MKDKISSEANALAKMLTKVNLKAYRKRLNDILEDSKDCNMIADIQDFADARSVFYLSIEQLNTAEAAPIYARQITQLAVGLIVEDLIEAESKFMVGLINNYSKYCGCKNKDTIRFNRPHLKEEIDKLFIAEYLL
jgi:hypothetical protein